MKPHHGCPAQATIDVMSGKWEVPILWHLSFGPKRFARLRNLLPGVNEKVPADQLRQLENDGVLHRDASPSIPPQVTYSLNGASKKIAPMMEELCGWGSQHFGIEPTQRRS